MAGTIGLVQNDIKRVLAYSTVSQLGYMFLAMGVGAFSAGIFHLYTHAFFKALLFLGSGAVIHALAGEQDIRNMGGLKKYLPITYWTFLIGALAIAGLPLLSGFFSKDEILFRTYTAVSTPGHLLMWGIATITSLMTATYMFRLVFLTFHGERRPAFASGSGAAGSAPAHAEEEERVAHGDLPAKAGSHPVHPQGPVASGFSRKDDTHDHGHGGGHGHTPHDAPWSMAIPLILLAVGSVFAGYVGVPHALHGSNRIESFLEPSFEAHSTEAPGAAAPPSVEIQAAGAEAGAETHADTGTELNLMIFSSVLALVGIGLAYYLWLVNRGAADALARSFAPIYRLLLGKYYVDEIYDAAVVQPVKAVSTVGLWKGVDAGLIDGTVNGVGLAVSSTSSVLRRTQTGSIRTYAFALFSGVVAILAYYLFT
jgi:NADH-quinone oxidoreductase subunit L